MAAGPLNLPMIEDFVAQQGREPYERALAEHSMLFTMLPSSDADGVEKWDLVTDGTEMEGYTYANSDTEAAAQHEETIYPELGPSYYRGTIKFSRMKMDLLSDQQKEVYMARKVAGAYVAGAQKIDQVIAGGLDASSNFPGLRYIAQNTGVYAKLDRALYPNFQPAHYDAAGTTLTEAKMKAARKSFHGNTSHGPNLILTNDDNADIIAEFTGAAHPEPRQGVPNTVYLPVKGAGSFELDVPRCRYLNASVYAVPGFSSSVILLRVVPGRIELRFWRHLLFDPAKIEGDAYTVQYTLGCALWVKNPFLDIGQIITS